MMKVILVMLISYLFGSIPWALVIGKTFYHKDIRNYGSGNLGATNAGRVLGKPAAVIVTVLDAIKCVISMAIASYIAPETMQYAGLACAIGHCYPLFAGFKGGKAVATSFGYFLGLALLMTGQWWWNFLFPVAVFFAVLWLCRMVSVSSLTAVGLEIVGSLIAKNPVSITVCIACLWLFVTWRHRENIQRVRNGTESKIKWMGERKHGKN